ncbi:MAG TPA: hypothetical protein VK586_21675 [Streptosporangiaceae bacterium]|nr:hypothetical protein [Streptosporangiaceae bacterium]
MTETAGSPLDGIWASSAEETHATQQANWWYEAPEFARALRDITVGDTVNPYLGGGIISQQDREDWDRAHPDPAEVIMRAGDVALCRAYTSSAVRLTMADGGRWRILLGQATPDSLNPARQIFHLLAGEDLRWQLRAHGPWEVPGGTMVGLGEDGIIRPAAQAG